MSKRKILYSDIPRPYDDEARRQLKAILIYLLIGGAVVLCLIANYGLQ